MPGLGPTRRLDDVVDELGFGAAQYSLLIFGGGTMILSGSIAMLMGAISPHIARELHLSNIERGSLVSCVFVGTMFGNVFAGYIADKFGRRPPLLVAYLLATVASLGSTFVNFSFASAFYSMLIWRSISGFGMGCAMGPWNAIAGEMCPSSSRMILAANGMILFCVGVCYSLVLIMFQDPEMKHLNWRLLVRFASLPGFVLWFVAYMRLPESLHYLDRTRPRAVVIAALERMRSLNGRPDVDVETWESSRPVSDAGMSPLISRSLLPTLVSMSLSTCVLNYSYYGMMYALPQVLPKVELGMSVTSNFFLSTGVEVIGLVFGVFLGKFFSRKALILIYLFGMAICTAIFCICLSFLSAGDADVMHHRIVMVLSNFAVSGFRLFTAIGFLFVYVYTIEVFPTSCRAFGSAIAVAFGRLGSIASPMMFEFLLLQTRTHNQFFLDMLLLALINVAVALNLPIETKDRQLGEISGETQPAKI